MSFQKQEPEKSNAKKVNLTLLHLSSIADYFRRDPVSLCQGMAKVERRMGEEDGFRKKLMGLEKNLVEGRKRKIKK